MAVNKQLKAFIKIDFVAMQHCNCIYCILNSYQNFLKSGLEIEDLAKIIGRKNVTIKKKIKNAAKEYNARSKKLINNTLSHGSVEGLDLDLDSYIIDTKNIKSLKDCLKVKSDIQNCPLSQLKTKR